MAYSTPMAKPSRFRTVCSFWLSMFVPWFDRWQLERADRDTADATVKYADEVLAWLRGVRAKLRRARS